MVSSDIASGTTDFEMSLASIIMRLEGVFALTGEAYFLAMNEALSEAGFYHRISRAVFAETFGHEVSRDQFLAYVSRNVYPRKQTSDLRTLFEVTFKHLRRCAAERLAADATVNPGPGVMELVRAAREKNVRLQLVTGLPLPAAEKLIANAGGPQALSMFDRIIKQDRADPTAAFIEARSAGGEPAIVLESSNPGLAAAEAAGIPSVAVIGSSVLADGIHGARAVVDKLADLVENASGEPDGMRLLLALDAIVAIDVVEGAARKIIDLQVQDVLRDKGGAVKSVNPTDTLRFLAQRLVSEYVGALVVIGDNGALEGIVCERDFARGIAMYGSRALDLPVSAIMTRAVITCAPVDSIHNVAKVMTSRRIRHLPVAEGDRLVGLISIGDVLNRRLAEVSYAASVMRHSGGEAATGPRPEAIDPALPPAQASLTSKSGDGQRRH